MDEFKKKLIINLVSAGFTKNEIIKLFNDSGERVTGKPADSEKPTDSEKTTDSEKPTYTDLMFERLDKHEKALNNLTARINMFFSREEVEQKNLDSDTSKILETIIN